MADQHTPVEFRAVGQHLLVDMYGVKPDVLTDEQSPADVLLSALRDARFNVVDYVSHTFPGHRSGVTGVAFVIAFSLSAALFADSPG